MNLYEAMMHTQKRDITMKESCLQNNGSNVCKTKEVKMNQPNKEDAVVVLSTGIARKLLHEGYQIMDIKPHKQQKSRTVFVFIREGNIEQRISDLHLLEERKSFHI